MTVRIILPEGESTLAKAFAGTRFTVASQKQESTDDQWWISAGIVNVVNYSAGPAL